MSYELDAELVCVMAALAEQAAAAPAPARGDWKTLRQAGELGQAYLATLVPPSAGIQTATFHATSDGASIELRWYTKTSREGARPASQAGAEPGPAVVYAHGGGMVLGTLDLYDELISWYVDRTGVPFLSVGYRRAPDEGTGTTLSQDVFAGLAWLLSAARELGVDPARVAVMGDSGGGGPAAGAAILARDLGIALARQILVYPMLDDRNQIPDPDRAAYLTWTYDNLDIFRDEAIAYTQNLARAGVPIELHVHPAVPHGWERFAPGSESAKRAMADRARAVASI